MGAWFTIANLEKRQYLSPSGFGNDLKFRYFLSDHVALAVALLVGDFENRDRYPHEVGDVRGSWFGNRIVFVSDSSDPNTLGLQTTTPEEPDRTLWGMCYQEFEDITLPALAMVLAWRESASEELIGIAVTSPVKERQLLRCLVALVTDPQWRGRVEAKPIEAALRARYGENWRECYKD
jgi:hypothetical protein